MDDLTAPLIAAALIAAVVLARAAARRRRHMRSDAEWRGALERLRQRQGRRRGGGA